MKTTKIKSHYQDPAREFFYRLYRWWDVRRKKKKAIRLHKEHKVTYYIYKIHDQLHVLNDFQLDECIKQGILNPNVAHARCRRRFAIFITN